MTDIDKRYILEALDRVPGHGLSQEKIRLLFDGIADKHKQGTGPAPSSLAVAKNARGKTYQGQASGEPLRYTFHQSYSLSKSVWNIVGDAEDKILDVVWGGISQGRDVRTVAADLMAYIKGGPDVVKGRWGKLKPETREYANRLGAKGVDYRALRLYRSEIHRHQQEAAVEEGEDNPACTGEYDWILMPGREVWLCDCEELAGAGPYTKETIPPYPHPNCDCMVRPRLKDSDDLIRDLKDYINGVPSEGANDISLWAQKHGLEEEPTAIKLPESEKAVIDMEIREGWSRKFAEKITEIMKNNAVGELDKELYEKLKKVYPDIDETLVKIKQFKDKNRIVVSFDLSKKIDYFIEELKYKTQFETGTSGGILDKKKRNEWETVIAGKNTDGWLEDKERPVYGCVADISKSAVPSARYGGSYFVLKEDVRKRTTYTIGNSSLQQGSFSDDPIAMFNKGKAITNREKGVSFAAYFAGEIVNSKLGSHSYLESQIWGGFDLLKDVDMLVIPIKNQLLPNMNNRDYLFTEGKIKKKYTSGDNLTDEENRINVKKWKIFKKMLEDAGVKVVFK
ncbi:MAG: DUF3626 domain-containing protein [Treponema sp.]|jgi:hypothetical protein|nr:DUF3626 domain-containing protein [Treponema sp.]